jgi:hypothetical protein
MLIIGGRSNEINVEFNSLSVIKNDAEQAMTSDETGPP